MTNLEDIPRRPTRRATLFKLGLLASICLNIALASYVVVSLRAPEPEFPVLRSAQQALSLLEQRLPAGDADVLRETYRTREPELAAARAAYQQARARAVVLAAQHDLDRDAFRAAIKDIREKRIRLGDLVTDIVENTVERLSPETRRKLVDRYRSR